MRVLTLGRTTSFLSRIAASYGYFRAQNSADRRVSRAGAAILAVAQNTFLPSHPFVPVEIHLNLGRKKS
ncbi:MAG: hypothetical protein ABIH69_04470 [bacterium]